MTSVCKNLANIQVVPQLIADVDFELETNKNQTVIVFSTMLKMTSDLRIHYNN